MYIRVYNLQASKWQYEVCFNIDFLQDGRKIFWSQDTCYRIRGEYLKTKNVFFFLKKNKVCSHINDFRCKPKNNLSNFQKNVSNIQPWTGWGRPRRRREITNEIADSRRLTSRCRVDLTTLMTFSSLTCQVVPTSDKKCRTPKGQEEPDPDLTLQVTRLTKCFLENIKTLCQLLPYPDVCLGKRQRLLRRGQRRTTCCWGAWQLCLDWHC